MKKKIDIWWVIIIVIVLFMLLKQCTKTDPEIVEKEVIKIVKVTDTINNTIIKEIPKKVYVEKTKTIKGKDTIIYRDTPNDSTINANQYQTTIKSDNASADLEITTTGELLDVKGVIHYNKETKTIERTKTINASGLFIYGKHPVSNDFNPEVGLMYSLNNKILIGAGANYNNFTNKIDATLTIGLKL